MDNPGTAAVTPPSGAVTIKVRDESTTNWVLTDVILVRAFFCEACLPDYTINSARCTEIDGYLHGRLNL